MDLFIVLAVDNYCDIALSTHEALLPPLTPRLVFLAFTFPRDESNSKGQYELIIQHFTYAIEFYLVSIVSLKAGWPSAFLGFHLPLVSIMTCSA